MTGSNASTSRSDEANLSAVAVEGHPNQPPKRGWPWGILIPLALQFTIIAAIAIPPVIIRTTGTTIYLPTAPVDPYDLLRGRYVTLNYSLETRNILAELPGWRSPDDFSQSNTEFPPYLYIVIAPESSTDTPEVNTVVPLWQPVAIAYELPTELEGDQQVIRAPFFHHGNIDIGLSQYFIPEAIGDQLEVDMNQNRASTYAEIKVNGQGDASLMGLWVEDRRY